MLIVHQFFLMMLSRKIIIRKATLQTTNKFFVKSFLFIFVLFSTFHLYSIQMLWLIFQQVLSVLIILFLHTIHFSWLNIILQAFEVFQVNAEENPWKKVGNLQLSPSTVISIRWDGWYWQMLLDGVNVEKRVVVDF